MQLFLPIVSLSGRCVVCHAQFRIVSNNTLQTRSADALSNHDLKVQVRFTTFWLARSIFPGLTLHAFDVWPTGFLTALLLINRVLSVGLNASRATTKLPLTPTWLNMLLPPSNNHPVRACQRSVHDPLSSLPVASAHVAW